uniref:Uncharacterized protein n=1 Tax=Quercus lobata TaxID=97700 RepID=A0A7N2MMD7_QUELO
MKILQMPLSRLPSRDVLVWKENQAQTFSVKSAYQVAQRLREQSRIEHSGVVADQSIWRRLCRLNVPPKALYRGNLQKCPNEAQDIFMLLRCLLDKLPQQELERWVVTAWVIWDARNKFYFEHIQTHPKVILDGAFGYLQEYQKLVAA